MSRVRSSLACASTASSSPAELRALQARAWHERRTIVINLDDVPDHLKPGLKDLMTRLHGRPMQDRR